GTARQLNRMTADRRLAALRDLPGVRPYLRTGKGGQVWPKWASLPRLYPATHHQKLAVIDRELLYIGGLDLDERRYDTRDHDRPGNQTWHDVQLMVRGPLAGEAQTHLESFGDVTAGRSEPVPQPRFLRTMSRPRRSGVFAIGPDTVVQDIAIAHEMLARRATRLIYLENQYFRDRKMARFLAGMGRDNAELRLILILPAAPDDVAFDGSDGLDARYGEYLQLRALRILRKGFGERMFVGGAAQRRRADRETDHDRDRLKGAQIIYLHAKVSIFDTTGAIVSSANLNGRSLRWDTEAGLLLDRASDVEMLRRRVMGHWLPESAGPEYLNPDTALENWRDLANANAGMSPELRRGFLLPYDFKAPTGIATPVPGVPEEMV
ncbi:MAG: phospholipase D-like domain-containing protein, partial [Albidovulum sp.]